MDLTSQAVSFLTSGASVCSNEFEYLFCFSLKKILLRWKGVTPISGQLCYFPAISIKAFIDGDDVEHFSCAKDCQFVEMTRTVNVLIVS